MSCSSVLMGILPGSDAIVTAKCNCLVVCTRQLSDTIVYYPQDSKNLIFPNRGRVRDFFLRHYKGGIRGHSC